MEESNIVKFNKHIQQLSAYMEEVHLKLAEALKENEQLKLENTQLLLQLAEVPILTEDLNNNDRILQKLPIQLNPITLKSFLNSLIEIEREQSTLQILEILLHYIQKQKIALAGICVSVLSFSPYANEKTIDIEGRLIEILILLSKIGI